MITRKKRIGWWEWVALPQTNLPPFKAKVDSGAETSSLHASDITPFMKGDDEWISFTLHGDNIKAQCEFPVFKKRKVRSSNGVEQRRYTIEMDITIGRETFTTEFTLSSRRHMKFQSLLGKRRLLAPHFLIEADKEAIQGKPKI